MGYFSNGSAGDSYIAQWCLRCVNWRDRHDDRGEGCPVYDLHLLYNYDQHKKDSTKRALEMFIPRDEHGGNGRCQMFWERGKGRPGGEPVPVPLTIVRAA